MAVLRPPEVFGRTLVSPPGMQMLMRSPSLVSLGLMPMVLQPGLGSVVWHCLYSRPRAPVPSPGSGNLLQQKTDVTEET